MKKRLTLTLNPELSKNLVKTKTDCLVLGVNDGGALNTFASDIDKATKGIIGKLRKRGEFEAKVGQTAYIATNDGTSAERIFLVGLGKSSKKLSAEDLDKISSAITSGLTAKKSSNGVVCLPDKKFESENSSLNALLQKLGTALESSTYTYDAKLNKKNKKVNYLKKVSILLESTQKISELRKSLKTGQCIGQGMNAAKDLANLPGNVCTPSYLASTSRTASRNYQNLSCKVFGEKEMKKMGMDCLLSVGNGSAQESKLISMNYQGGKKGQKPYAIVGKGITFDTGGISLKPPATMDEMKFDMCGAASVIATMQVVAELKLPINLIGVVASAENMPGSKATKPGDVVKTMSGKTVEILNTDAEGRLVLADALTYVERFNPVSVIDIATLTGAVIMALGYSTSGLMSNNDELAKKLLEAGEKASDRAWQLPLWDVYQKDLDSNFADIANIGGRAGTITAACFLSRFAEKYPWAHLDVAGTASLKGAAKGGSGRPVPLLSQYLIDIAG
ncbi:MAG: leucyl aminopeptidase [Gammaproteobacteria bacterium]|jgi:leucyl aminopeptidase|nr:leucyl aminopeptidase [Gammaproteobacteria bacterium]|tara:strand:+ start:356 stop:1873 length:1518 start_codon:yes stop_codon:yes gene_type:complete